MSFWEEVRITVLDALKPWYGQVIAAIGVAALSIPAAQLIENLFFNQPQGLEYYANPPISQPAPEYIRATVEPLLVDSLSGLNPR